MNPEGSLLSGVTSFAITPAKKMPIAQNTKSGERQQVGLASNDAFNLLP
jgi:hypothetical protein